MVSTLEETKNENNKLKTLLNDNKTEILKLNDKTLSFSKQTQFQKKVIHERDLRIKELTNVIKQSETLKNSYTQQIIKLKSKLNQLNKTLNDNDKKYEKYIDENRVLNEYTDNQKNIFNKEFENIKSNTSDSNKTILMICKLNYEHEYV